MVSGSINGFTLHLESPVLTRSAVFGFVEAWLRLWAGISPICLSARTWAFSRQMLRMTLQCCARGAVPSVTPSHIRVGSNAGDHNPPTRRL